MPSLNNNPTEATTVYNQITGYVKLVKDAQTGDGSEKILPLSAFQSRFVVNMIPTASVVIPVGKSANLEAKEEVIKARELSEELKQFQRIEVYLNISGDFAPNVSWPTDDFRVFNGYVTGTGTTRSTGVISVIVQATHWLMDLDASSSLSDELTAGSPVALNLPPLAANLSAQARDPDDPILKKFSENLWVEALKPKFISLCKGGSLATQLTCVPKTNTQLIQGSEISNDTALPRLENADGRFDDETKIDVPKIAFVPQLDASLKGSISQAVTKRLLNGSTGRSTLWEKLEEIARLFELTIIPNIDSAAVVPMSPCLAGENAPRHVTIKANEYYSLNPSEPTFRIWRGVAIMGHFTAAFGGVDPSAMQDRNKVLTSNGCYIADEDDSLPDDYRSRAKYGTLQFVNAPDWVMDRSMEAALNMRLTLPTTALLRVPNNTMEVFEDFDGPPIPPVSDVNDVNTRDEKKKKILGDLYAKWYYWTNQFLSRTGNITGKLRFDIAPGSIVRIEDIDGKLYDSAAEFGYLYALITSVQVTVDAVEGKASTSFTLSHIRRESEKNYGTEKHPLYQDRWVGTVLQNLTMRSNSKTFIPSPKNHEVA